MKINRLVDKYSLHLLSFSIFFIRLPPLFLFFIKTPFLNSHSIARYALLVLLANTLVSLYKGRGRIRISSTFVLLVLFYFLTQSTSIIHTVNVGEFFSRYKTILFGLITLIVAGFEIGSEKKMKTLLRVLVASVIANLVIETVIYFQVPILFKVFTYVVNDQYLQDLELNMLRNRYFIDMFDTALIPLLFYFLFFEVKNLIGKLFYIALILLVIIFSLLSNFRAQLIVAILTTISSSFIFMRQFRKTILLISSLTVLFFVFYGITADFAGYNAFDRIISPESEDYTTISDRFYYWEKGVEMGKSQPITGVGLGNYYEHLTNKEILRNSLFDPKNTFMKITWVHPHNVFVALLAETGLPGLGSFVLLLLYFVITDFVSSTPPSSLRKALILSFWGLFSFSLINPAAILNYTVLFWLIRIFIDIEKNQEYKRVYNNTL